MKIKQFAQNLDSPFYLYDIDALNSHVRKLKEDAPVGVRLWYACKANPLSAVLEVMNKNGIGFDVASGGEFGQVQKVAGKEYPVLCTGPAKSKKYLAKLIDEGINTFVVESINQLAWLNEASQEKNKRVRTLLRLQLSWKEFCGASSVLGGDQVTPFGLTPDEWKKINITNYQNIEFIGIHLFQWGNILSDSVLCEVWEKCAQIGAEFCDEMGIQKEVIDVGGGLGIPYEEGEQRLIFANLANCLNRIKNAYGFAEAWMELGRFAVGEFGKYFTRVVDKKEVRGRDILVLESGVNHMVRAALVKQSFPVKNLEDGYYTSSFQLHGPLCTALDTLGEHSLNDNTEIGDWLEFSQCGAYGFTESMPFFLGHDLPAEVALINGDFQVLRKPVSAQSYFV